ncbi:plasmid mobilization protein [Actinomadura sp. 9N215]|uniref:plasmid mobilization protein n=1 Tax=Actinomadura sp. 9N215 TaxID=3375150 RepID=UPI003789F8F6
MSEVAQDGEDAPGRGLQRRPRQGQARLKVMRFRVNQAEEAEIVGAAKRQGLAYGAFVARAAVAAARDESRPVDSVLRELHSDLNAATRAMNRMGVNFNQVVREMHATGQIPGNMERYAEVCIRAVQRVDDIAIRIGRRLR